MTDDTHVLDLLPAFSLGSLDTDEVSRVEEHLLSCLICRNESNAIQAAVEQLSFAVPVAVPSPGLRDRLMQRVQAAQPDPRVQARAARRPWLERLLPVWGLISLCLIIVLAGANLLLWQRFNQLEVLTVPGKLRAVPLNSQDAAIRASGYVLISADGDNGALVVDGLPPLGESRQYQLWLIRDGQMTSGAVFSTDEENYGGTRIRVPGSLLEYSAVDITIEPAGGSPQPTGSVVLGGRLFNP